MHPTLDPAPPVDADLQAAYERMLRNLAELVSHRIRSQLACIDGYTNLLLDALDQPDQRELCFRLLESVSDIEGVLCDLNYFGQPIVPVAQTLDFHDFLGDFLTTLPDEALARLMLDIQTSRPLAVQTDPYLLRQVLLILLQNALEAHPTAAIRLRTTHEGGQLALEVWSQGTLETERAELLEEPFYTTKAQHLGLGLAIARRIATAQNATLDLVDHSGDLVCFKLGMGCS